MIFKVHVMQVGDLLGALHCLVTQRWLGLLNMITI